MCELQWGPVVFWWSCFKFLLYLHMTITFLDGIRCVLGQKMPPLLSTPAEHTVLSGLYPREKKMSKIGVSSHQNPMFIVCIQLAVSTDTSLLIKAGNY